MARPNPESPDVATIADLFGNTPRAAMVTALMGEHAMPASQLALIAHISRPTASEHLSRLVEHDILTVERIGRNAYYRISSPAVAELIESLAVIAPIRQPTSLHGTRTLTALQQGRTCYKHLAGKLGVALADALQERGVVRRTGVGLELDRQAWAEQTPLGLAAPAGGGRPVIRGCVDWSERRHHVAGGLANTVAERLFELGWITRSRAHRRAVTVTDKGHAGLRTEFDLILDDQPDASH